MRSIGFLLILLGVGTPVLNAMGMQFALLSWAGSAELYVAIAAGVIGLILVVLSFTMGKKEEPEQPTASE